MTTEATPSAPAEGTPEAATSETKTPESTAAAPAAKPASLLDTAPPAAGAEPAPEPAKPTDPPTDAKWFYADGTPGKGDVPAWFKADKYKSVEAQAQAYTELEKRFGAFTGAPKDGKYEAPQLPEGIQGEFITDHPAFQMFSEWAAKNQLSQAAYNDVLGMFAQYEASTAPNMEDVKKALGENADGRIGAVAQWGQANLGQEGYEMLREATSGANAAVVFQVLEKVIAQARQPAMPKPGSDVPAGQPTGIEQIKAMHAAKGPDGRRLYETDPHHREKVEKAYRDYYAAQESAA